MKKALANLAFALILTLPVATEAAETRLSRTLPSGATATLTLAASPLTTMTEIPFAVRLQDAKGAPVDDAALEISLDMPDMPMPPNRPQSVWSDDAYRGNAVFTMAGAWVMRVRCLRPGMDATEFEFPLPNVRLQ